MINDGFKSRKFLSTAVGTGVIFVAATIGWLVLDKMTSVEWTGFVGVLWPLALSIFCGANVAEKHVTKKE